MVLDKCHVFRTWVQEEASLLRADPFTRKHWFDLHEKNVPTLTKEGTK